MSEPAVVLEDFTDEGAEALRSSLVAGGSEVVRLCQATYGAMAHNVIATRDPLPGNGIPDKRWHISIAAPGAVPSWAALVAIVHALRPGVPFCVGLPPRSWWINVHPNVLHVWELNDPNLIAQWRAERGGHQPS
jgi:hypothetical protein